MIIMMVPNIIFAIKNKGIENVCTNKVMNVMEQIGRYTSMFLLIFNVGILEWGFHSNESFVMWCLMVFLLLMLYLFIWTFYFKSKNYRLALLLAIIPSIIFIISGFFMRHLLLIISGMIFSIGHIYITIINNKDYY